MREHGRLHRDHFGHVVRKVTEEHATLPPRRPVPLGERDRLHVLGDRAHDRPEPTRRLDLGTIQRRQLERGPRRVIVDPATGLHDHARMRPADATLGQRGAGAGEPHQQRRPVRHPPLHRPLGHPQRRRNLRGHLPQRHLPIPPRRTPQPGRLQLDHLGHRGIQHRLMRLQRPDLRLRTSQTIDQTAQHHPLRRHRISRRKIVQINECHTPIIGSTTDINDEERPHPEGDGSPWRRRPAHHRSSHPPPDRDAVGGAEGAITA